MALLIRTDGDVRTVEPEDKRRGFTLKEVYDVLEVSIVETVDLPDGSLMVVDEEGLLKDEPIQNVQASLLARRFIAGHALICSQEEFR